MILDQDDDDQFDHEYLLFRTAWDAADREHRRRRVAAPKRWTVCWWRHRTRKAGTGTYVSGTCWACSDRG